VKKRFPIDNISPLPKPKIYNETKKKDGRSKAVLLTSTQYKDGLKRAKEKKNTKELKQQDKKIKKGKQPNAGSRRSPQLEGREGDNEHGTVVE
jgi:hypothetical protein